jgi:membrane-bound ClpP family serine protease
MRSVNLIKVAIEAEILRYKSMAARQGRRAGFGVAALIFGLGFLITLEIAGWQVARMYMLSIYATLCLMGLNFVVAAVFGFVAMRSSPDRSETDALEVRKKAVQALQTSMTISAIIPAAGYLWRRRSNKRSQVKRLR